VCRVAPIPGETKVWQYITLMKSIFLIDCPGVVYPSGDTETELVLKGVVRVENIGDAVEHIPGILQRVKKEYITRTYKIEAWEDHIDFLTQFAKRSGKLFKGGEADLNTVSKMILNDWQRGKIPYFVCPAFEEDEKQVTTEDANIPQVKQIFDKIPVVNKFTEDAPPRATIDKESQLVEIPDWDKLYESVKNEEVENENIENQPEEEKEETNTELPSKEPPVYDEEEDDLIVWNSDGEEEIKDPVPLKKKRKGEQENDGGDEPSIPTKKARMTTNKRKVGVHYYETANVKNKNRNRKKSKKIKHQTMKEKGVFYKKGSK